ncbi:hypothetical protein BGW41_000197, partial [Actinomortierella wolfii]
MDVDPTSQDHVSGGGACLPLTGFSTLTVESPGASPLDTPRAHGFFGLYPTNQSVSSDTTINTFALEATKSVGIPAIMTVMPEGYSMMGQLASQSRQPSVPHLRRRLTAPATRSSEGISSPSSSTQVHHLMHRPSMDSIGTISTSAASSTSSSSSSPSSTQRRRQDSLRLKTGSGSIGSHSGVPPLSSPGIPTERATYTSIKSDDLPPYEEMIFRAIAALNEEAGSAPKAILDWIAVNYPVPEGFRNSCGQAISKAAKKQKLQKQGGAYKLVPTYDYS